MWDGWYHLPARFQGRSRSQSSSQRSEVTVADGSQKAPSGGVEAGGVRRPLAGVKLAPRCQTRLRGPTGAASHRAGSKPPLAPLGEKIMPAPPPVSLVETPPHRYIWERFWRVSTERHRLFPGAHCIWVGRGWRRDGCHRLFARCTCRPRSQSRSQVSAAR